MQAQNRESKLEMALLEPITKDTLLLVRWHLLSFSKQHHQQGANYSNARYYGNVYHSNHYVLHLGMKPCEIFFLSRLSTGVITAQLLLRWPCFWDYVGASSLSCIGHCLIADTLVSWLLQSVPEPLLLWCAEPCVGLCCRCISVGHPTVGFLCMLTS